MSYNLLGEKWLPVLWKDGKTSRVGVIEAFTRASRIRQIAACNPMDRLAILRFLLALLYWCEGNPPVQLPDAGHSFPPDLFQKLRNNKDCFNLLGDGKRFYQNSNAKREQAVTHLIQEIPSGNNFSHFRHSTDRTDGLCLSCCVMGLLRLPLFSVSGLSGPKEPDLMAGINGVPPIYVVPWGKSLKETLLANWTRCSNLGEPSWVNPNDPPNQDAEVPLLTGLTMLPRKVWLHNPDQPGVCIGCGSHGMALVRTIEYQTAGKQENDKWNDPHVVYITGKKRKTLRAEDLTKAGNLRMDRPWSDLLAHILETNRPASLLVVGFATKKALNIDVWERDIEIPSAESIKHTAAGRIKEWQEEGQNIAKNAVIQIKRLEKTSSRKHVEFRPIITSIRPHVEDKVAARMDELVARGGDAWDKAALEYRPMMAAIAKSLSPGFTTSALERRRRIAGVMPDMRQKAVASKNPRKKMEGGGN